MLRIVIEKHSAIDGKVSTLGVLDICNDGKGTPKRGNYYGRLMRKPGPGQHWTKVLRTGAVNDYPRLSYNVWRLVIRMLLDIFPEEQRAPKVYDKFKGVP